jgi:hypothetical protein
MIKDMYLIKNNLFQKKFYYILWQANPFLGGTIRNHLKEWFKNQKQSNHFSKPFSLNVFIAINYYFLCLSIACFNKWLEVYLAIIKADFLKFYIPN